MRLSRRRRLRRRLRRRFYLGKIGRTKTNLLGNPFEWHEERRSCFEGKESWERERQEPSKDRIRTRKRKRRRVC